MTDLRIRRASGTDAARIAEIHIAAWQAAYLGIMADEVLDGLEHGNITSSWERNLSDDQSPMTAFVVEAPDGLIAGFGGICPPRDSAEVLDQLPDTSDLGQLAFINVHPGSFGTGVASALFRRLEDELRTTGFTRAYLMVAEGNERAMRFYDKHGWRRTDITHVYEGVNPPVPERLYFTSL